MKDVGLLVMRLVVGMLLAGHGSQKLFGWWGGYGLPGTAQWLGSMGLRPPQPWAVVAGGAEFLGGLLTALGFLHPLGPLIIYGPMGVATGKVHWGKPIWVSEGGAELPAVNMAVALGLVLTGPGRYSLDRLLGVRVPLALAGLTAAGVAAGIAAAVSQRPPQAEEKSADETVSDVATSEERQSSRRYWRQ